jgi:hypothetical protein
MTVHNYILQSIFDMQSLAAARSYSTRFKSPSTINSHVQPILQEANEDYEIESRAQGPGLAHYQVWQPSPQIDWIIETLRQEIIKHKESTRKINYQLEQVLYRERIFNHFLRVNFQEARAKSTCAKRKLQAYEQNLDMVCITSPKATAKRSNII